MEGGNRQELNPVKGTGIAAENAVEESKKINDLMINGEQSAPTGHKGSGKRLASILGLLLALAVLSAFLYWVFFRAKPTQPASPPPPRPVTTYIKVEGDKDLASLAYGMDYSVDFSGSNYLVNVSKSPKRLIYNGKEVYRGEDLVSSTLSKNGKYWAAETLRQEMRAKRDENTKLVQETSVPVSTYSVNGQKWGEKDNSRLLGVTDNGAPVMLYKTGKQTPSQYGDALNEEAVYSGENEKFRTSYGIVSFRMSSDASNWLAITANPSTKEIYDFFVNNTKKDSLDARILKRISIDKDGNYLLAFCQQEPPQTALGSVGKDCQISVNGKTRTTISGTVYLADTLGSTETYAGVDRELKQAFVKNNRVDLILEHNKDLDEDAATLLGVYLNESGDKYAVTTTRKVEDKVRVNLSINAGVIANTVSTNSLFGFGHGDDSSTLFIYELPRPEVTPNVTN